jgi:hypothetical protein
VSREAQEPWVLKAEALIGHVDLLLQSRKRIKRALAKKHGDDTAEAMLDQLEHLLAALDAEVFRMRDARSPQRAGVIARAIGGGLLFVAASVAEAEIGQQWHELRTSTDLAAEVAEMCLSVAGEPNVFPPTVTVGEPSAHLVGGEDDASGLFPSEATSPGPDTLPGDSPGRSGQFGADPFGTTPFGGTRRRRAAPPAQQDGVPGAKPFTLDESELDGPDGLD